MDKLAFDAIANECTTFMRKIAPNATGNLANHGVTLVHPENNVAQIYIDMVEAPYMPYTNEPWISPRWGGKKNPNEGWFDRAAEALAQRIATMCGGTLQRKDNNS